MTTSFQNRENVRRQAFESIWESQIDAVFSDVAAVYDRANDFASLGTLNRLRRRFIATIDVSPGQRVLDVCAGTNVIGIDLLKKEPNLDIYAVDRSDAMQKVGSDRAAQQGFDIKGHICDVHRLPFPDNHFDVVTLQYATRHLRVIDVFSEINRVLKPGGHFYHFDMLRPASKIIEEAYCLYLRGCLKTISWAIRVGPEARNCCDYFIDAIRLFYSTDELSRLLSELGFSDVIGKPLLGGTVAIHKACKV
ncbi:MAG: class I SAM-dependent methyltransferase [Candidatus Thiodiazotropha sp. (ex Cardiolucina cf. quadrata)]|nr:class I SAM-dependent methyltransferase [Candidatus Thiodiazotropha sp. (ex Cardiolucina cf. quadrata)]